LGHHLGHALLNQPGCPALSRTYLRERRCVDQVLTRAQVGLCGSNIDRICGSVVSRADFRFGSFASGSNQRQIRAISAMLPKAEVNSEDANSRH